MNTLTNWRKLNGDRITKPIYAAVEEVLRHETQLGNRIKVCIGTDSQVYGNVIEFATVIVFLREKKGGFMYIHSDRITKQHSVKERLLLEVSKSVEIAYHLCDLFDTYAVDMEVHADINTNPHFQSNLALHEAMGYIKAMGFAFKAKPEAFASSRCANKAI